MKIHWFMLLLIGAIGGTTACDRQTPTATLPSPNVPEAGTAPIATSQTAPNAPANAQAPAQAAAKGLAPIPVPELIPPTVGIQRLPQIEVGRSDPFAALPVTPTLISKATPAESAPPATVAANAPATVIPLPPVTIAPPLPIVQPAMPGPLLVPPAPRPVSPTGLAEAIEISGVLEVGGKTNIIVKVPEEGTSRSVRVGDALANGQVRIKRVEMGMEPIVVLEQNGREVTRSVGSGTLMGLI